MNILFLSLVNLEDLSAPGIYTDLLREFTRQGHRVWAACPAERRLGRDTRLIPQEEGTVLRIRTGNIQKTNLLEKGISTIRLEGLFIRAIRRYLADVSFDLVLYATPPVTLANVVRFVKKRDGARSYLMLKDIFPQNAVDLGMLSTTGLKGLIWRYFRKKEQTLYALSDGIGCMSPANVAYLCRQDPQVDPAKVGLCPNSEAPRFSACTPEEKQEIRARYGLPADKKVFLYGGNLGRPQGIPFLIQCLQATAGMENIHMVVCGTGTEYGKLAAYVAEERPEHVSLFPGLPREEYDRLVPACDVGMLFLDYRFTIPNFPSRLLSYLQAGLPVLCCTDPHSDVGDAAREGGFGWKCLSHDTQDFVRTVEAACQADLPAMGAAGQQYFLDHYTAQRACSLILQGLEHKETCFTEKH